MRPPRHHRTFEADRPGETRHLTGRRLQRHDLVAEVAAAPPHQLDRRRALALVRTATHDDDAVAAVDRRGVGEEVGVAAEHDHRRDRRQQPADGVAHGDPLVHEGAVLGDSHAAAVAPEIEAVDRHRVRGRMGGEKGAHDRGQMVVVADDLERLAEGVEPPDGGVRAGGAAQVAGVPSVARGPRPHRARRRAPTVGAGRRPPSSGPPRTSRRGPRRPRRCPRNGRVGAGRSPRRRQGRASTPNGGRRAPACRRHRRARTTSGAPATSRANGTAGRAGPDRSRGTRTGLEELAHEARDLGPCRLAIHRERLDDRVDEIRRSGRPLEHRPQRRPEA